MSESFSIPLIYQGEAQEYKARFERYGYTHRVTVLIDEETITFEPDEEGGYRALGGKLVAHNLLLAISEKLSTLIS